MLNIAIAYINPFSTFDYTSGSSKSISVILKNLNDIGCNVFSLCSCVSYSKAGFKKSIEIDNQSNNESEIRNFIFNKSNELKNELRNKFSTEDIVLKPSTWTESMDGTKTQLSQIRGSSEKTVSPEGRVRHKKLSTTDKDPRRYQYAKNLSTELISIENSLDKMDQYIRVL